MVQVRHRQVRAALIYLHIGEQSSPRQRHLIEALSIAPRRDPLGFQDRLTRPLIEALGIPPRQRCAVAGGRRSPHAGKLGLVPLALTAGACRGVVSQGLKVRVGAKRVEIRLARRELRVARLEP